MYESVHILQNIGDMCSEGRLTIITENYWTITLNVNEIPKIDKSCKMISAIVT